MWASRALWLFCLKAIGFHESQLKVVTGWLFFSADDFLSYSRKGRNSATDKVRSVLSQDYLTTALLSSIMNWIGHYVWL